MSVYIHTQITKLTFVQRTSNHAKQSVMADFLDFIDANSQPNGRQSGSYSAQFFFHPKFTRIAPPKQGEKNYDEKAHSSLVHEFNRVQGEMRKGTCGPTAASEWLKKHRPKVALHPSMTDYCDTCKSLKEKSPEWRPSPTGCNSLEMLVRVN